MSAPKVSIVTICLNSERYLEQTIQSVLAQTYPNIEYIIVDGGSKDGTLDIVRKYEGRISAWVSEPDRGISDAFNKGLKMCHGDVIGLINSDDWYEPDAVAAVVEQFQAHPEAGVVHGDLQYWAGDRKDMYLMPGRDISKIRYDMVLNHAACFLRKSVYERNGGFKEDYQYAMDYELMLRLFKNNVRFVYAGKLLAHMRLGGKSDKYWRQAYREALRCNLQYQDSKLLSYLNYVYKVLRTSVRSFLYGIGLDGMVVAYRRLQGRKKYSP